MAPTLEKVQRERFREGETVMIIEPRGKPHFVRLKSGGRFYHRRTGYIDHESIIGAPPGGLFSSESGITFICLRPTLEEYILKKLHRKTSIIHPKDLASILVRGDIYPGARVVEAGVGSGATTIFLLRHLGGEGSLVSYERREDFIDLARKNIEEVHRLLGHSNCPHVIRHRDVYENGFEEEDQDLVVIDVPEPHRVVGSALAALRPGGVFLSWLPTVNQVYILGRELQRQRQWAGVEVRETLERAWTVAEGAMRPSPRMVGHTGFWVRARKLEDATDFSEKTSEL
ncbi:MAG TPA: tRNA (adenine-N1)-methyltransferase [Acidobacteriota bacterium]|nr:tRNA (adenine-N1)-methyltransferase [Acidobacteriota bacterium]